VLCVNNIIERRQCSVVDILIVVLNTRLRRITTITTILFITIIVVFVFLPFFFLSLSSDSIDDQSTREREREESFWLPLLHDYHHSFPSPLFSICFSRANVSDTCLYTSNYSAQIAFVEI